MPLRYTVATASSFVRTLLVISACSLLLLFSSDLRASISYTTAGSNVTQDFNTLPTTPTNTSLGNTPAGWKDDQASGLSIPGWYLYHTADLTTGEGGFSGHQRMRIGTGSANTGAFWDFGSAAATDRALGSVGSANVADCFWGIRLTNNTGTTLGKVTLSYTGEEWRDGGTTLATPSLAQSVTLGYAVTSSSPTNIGDFNATSNAGGISGVTTLGSGGFTSPAFGATAGVSKDGNAAANRVGVAVTFGGFEWLPGQDLWLRWSDPNHADNDHGLAIDDVTLSVDVAVNVNSIANGPASSPSTWSDGQAPAAVKNYHVVNGNVVTLNAAFPGDILKVENGSVDINSSGSGQSFTVLSIEAGGNLTESVTGDVTIGTSASSLKVNRDLTFNGFEAGAKLTLAADVTGSGNMDFNSNGAGSEVIVSRLGGHTGTVRFNGTGDTVRLQGPEGFNIVEMNSTGANKFSYEPTTGGQVNGGSLIFNQAGTLDHAATTDRLQGGSLSLVANAPVTVDLTKFFTGNERRMLVADEIGAVTGHVQGGANITVNGTSTAPAGGDITRNEFEIGGTSPEPVSEISDSYSGTMTLNDYVNLEVRHNLKNAKIVVGNNALLDMGHKVLTATKSVKIGSVEVNSGGTLEVGFEESTATVSGHHIYHLSLTGEGSRDGDLTLHTGATVAMQINGTGATQYDTITAEGNVALGGTLNVLVSPVVSSGTTGGSNPVYVPAVGDKFDLIKINPVAPLADYNLSGTTNSDDYFTWRSTFDTAVTAGTGADGNGNGGVDAGDYVFWRKHEGETTATLGAISGAFDAVTFSQALPGGVAYQLNQTATLLQLEFIAGSGASLEGSAVPEPATLALCGLSLALIVARRPERHRRHN